MPANRDPNKFDDVTPGASLEMRDVIEDALKRHGAAHEVAADHAFVAVSALSEFFGGRMFYLPKGDRVKVAMRADAIFRDVGRMSVKEAAAKYGISEVRVYQILKKQRANRRRVSPATAHHPETS
jgi:Mor family transcriptional regulator